MALTKRIHFNFQDFTNYLYNRNVIHFSVYIINTTK